MAQKRQRITSRNSEAISSLNQIIGPLPTMPVELTLCTATLRVRRGRSAQLVVRFPGDSIHVLDAPKDCSDLYAQFNLKFGRGNL